MNTLIAVGPLVVGAAGLVFLALNWLETRKHNQIELHRLDPAHVSPVPPDLPHVKAVKRVAMFVSRARMFVKENRPSILTLLAPVISIALIIGLGLPMSVKNVLTLAFDGAIIMCELFYVVTMRIVDVHVDSIIGALYSHKHSIEQQERRIAQLENALAERDRAPRSRHGRTVLLTSGRRKSGKARGPEA